MADWTLILWRRDGPEDFDALAEEGYRLLSLFREGEDGPAFETVRDRSQAKLFPWTEEAFAGTLRKGQTNQGNLLLGDLGYSVSFFSGGERPVGYRLHTGDRKGLDAFVVHIPEERQWGTFSPERMGEILRRSAAIFRPFWGCVDTGMPPEGSYLGEDGRPALCWLNYWPEPMARKIGKLRIRLACAGTEAEFKDGILRTGPLPPTEEERAALAHRLGFLKATLPLK